MINQQSKTFFSTILLLLVGFYSYAQIIDVERDPIYMRVFVDTDNFGPSYLDSLEQGYLNIENDTVKLAILSDLSYYWHTRNLEKSLVLTKKGISRSREKGYEIWEGRFQIIQGAVLLRMEKLDSAFTVLQEARKKVMKEDLPLLITQEGYVFERKGDLNRATDYAYEALELGEALGDRRAMAVAYSDLGNLLWKHGRYEEGLELSLKSIELFESRGLNDMDYDFTLYVVGNNYKELGNYKEAQNYYNHCIAMGERYGFYNNLSDVYISMIDLYASQGQFDEAYLIGEKAVDLAMNIGNQFLLMRSYLSVGKMQNLQGKFGAAIESFTMSLEYATPDFGDKFFLSQVYESLARAYAGIHNYKDAIEAFNEYDRLKDELFTEEAEQKISSLQAQFEVAKRDTQILDQQELLEKQRSNQTLITVIAGLLSLFLLLLYITYHNNKVKNTLLEAQNKEKEFLLKEIHHRVKNNLGIVSSLLDLQSEEMDDPKVVQAIHESQNRVYSMSMIHQKLYQGENLSAIEMRDYFIELSDHIFDSFGNKERIDFSFSMEEIELDVDTAIPLGLIVNELITNALKHAFPSERKGEIQMFFKRSERRTIVLEVADNGIGMQESEEEIMQRAGFGNKLIALLVQQLDATMRRKSEGGTKVQIEFGLS